ncbi:MAG: M14 family metallopeptidase [Mongoliitalea sp.]
MKVSTLVENLMAAMKIYYQSNLLLLFVSLAIFACEPKLSSPSIDAAVYEQAYEQYQEPSVDYRRFKYADVIHLVTGRSGAFEVEEVGKSILGKSIYQMSMGTGPTKVLLWSQMHGNEATATMALFDLFNFLEGSNDDFEELRAKLKSKLTLRFIPMLNPDGMDLWIRRNAFDIDLNRDALALTSPEAAILKNARDSFEPMFGFNLHDQQTYYTVGETGKPATISVLAPAYNYATEVNDVRKRAMQVIVGMNALMEQIEPGHVGKYDDAFEPRAFGDNIQKWGTSTILIESGGYPNDPEKQVIRKYNFMLMLHALEQIADNSYEAYSLDEYYAIPDNTLRLMDLVIRNLSLELDEQTYTVDLGIRRREADAHGDYFVNAVVDDLGDLSIFYGYDELDATGLKVVEGKTYETPFKDLSEITTEKAFELLKEGYLAVRVQNALDKELHQLPIQVLKNGSISNAFKTGANSNFFLKESGKLRYAIVNGYLIDLENPANALYKMRVL